MLALVRELKKPHSKSNAYYMEMESGTVLYIEIRPSNNSPLTWERRIYLRREVSIVIKVTSALITEWSAIRPS